MGLSIKTKIESSRIFCRWAVNVSPAIPSISDMHHRAGEKSNMKTSAIVKLASLRMARSRLLAILGLMLLPIYVNSALADASITYPSSFDELAPQYDLNPCYAVPGPNDLGAAEGACDGAENAWVNPISTGEWRHRVVPPWAFVGGNPPTVNTPPEWTELTQNEFIDSNGNTNGFVEYGDTLDIQERCDNGGTLGSELDSWANTNYPHWCLVVCAANHLMRT